MRKSMYIGGGIRLAVVVCLLLGGLAETAAAQAGHVRAWGWNDYGQLGNGTNITYVLPVQVSNLTNDGPVSPVVAVAGGNSHSVALKSNGTVWAWGDNSSNQLGDGTNTSSNLPVRVSNLTAVAIAGGAHHSLAVKSDGTVWAWGNSSAGQIGTYNSSNAPVQVSNLTDVVAVSGGGFHSLALKNDSTVWAWGANDFGQLGNGTNSSSSRVPTPVSNLSGVVAVAGGGYHSVALKGDGTVWTWGDDSFGQLGTGISSNVPVQVSFLTGVVAIAGGLYHSLALKGDGTVWAWGRNDSGQLGNGTNTDGSLPVGVRNLTGVVAIAGGFFHSLALKSDGTAWTWGSNGLGQLGNGTSTKSNLPVVVRNLTGVVAIAGGGSHSLALENFGASWGTGYNPFGQIGNPTPARSHLPVAVNLSGVVAISGGGFHSLALRTDGRIWASGRNWDGQLGTGSSGFVKSPVPVVSLPGVSAIAAGAYHSLALTSDARVWAWGPNFWGELGNGSTDISRVPLQVNLDAAVAIAAGWSHSLALKSDGTVWTWGLNESGQLGSGSTDNSSEPLQVNNLSGVVAIAAGWVHNLALKSDGTVWAWGANWYGELGDGTNIARNVPVRVSNLTGVVAIAGGGSHSLALKSDGTVRSWGANPFGQLGDGTNASRSVPVAVTNLAGVTAIAAGGYYSSALKSDGTVRSWGGNDFGELGTGISGSSNVPVIVRHMTTVLGIAGGVYNSFAIGASEIIPQAKLAPSSLNFGNQALGFSSSPKTITLTNSGTAPMSISIVRLQGLDTGEFTTTGDNCSLSTLMAGNSCTISVEFTPEGLGNRSAALLVTTNAPRSPHLIPLSGTGGSNTTIQSITVVQPNGGEKLFTGTSFRIDWTISIGSYSSFDVKFSFNGGTSSTNVPGCTGLAGTARSCTWATPGPVTTAGRIQVIGRTSGGSSASDNSNANFSIVAGTPQITLTAPNTAVNWGIGSDQLIKWTHNLGTGTFAKIEVSRDAGVTWSQIAGSVPNSGSYSWKVTAPATTKGRVRVSWTANPAVKDSSAVNFTIAAPFITMSKPNGGEQWKKGSTQTVTWTSNLGSAEFVKIELSTNGGVSWLSTLKSSTPSNGTEAVVLPAVTSTKCRVRITWLENAAVRDLSNANFSLIP